MSDLRSGSWSAGIWLLFLLPALHPLLLPIVGVPSHLLWFTHVLPVAWITYHRGQRAGILGVILSLILLLVGERAFGAGYFVAADWQTVISLLVALGFTDTLVAGFAAYARRARSLQEQLWHSQKMEALGLFAASIAHDFNNVLTVVIASTELALDETPPGDPRREYLTEIQSLTERAVLLAKRLLAFGRRDASTAVELNLAEVILDLETMLRRLISKGVELRVLAENVPLVIADRGQVEQILINLVVNANDAITDRGTITVTARPALSEELRENRSNSSRRHVLLEVRDTGIGMDAALQRRIFDPLFTTKPPGKGTGLGLSTVKGLAAAWDGFVTLASAVGGGSVFRVFFPITDAGP